VSTSGTVLWRGFDRRFVEAIAATLNITVDDAHLTTVVLGTASEAFTFAVSIYDGNAETVILTSADTMNVHQCFHGQTGFDLTLPDRAATEVRDACLDLLQRVRACTRPGV
jgi:hypothetical protein